MQFAELYDQKKIFLAFEGHKGRKAKKGQKGLKNKYGSKCLELPNSSRNAIKKIQCGIVRPHSAAPQFRTMQQVRKVMVPNFYF